MLLIRKRKRKFLQTVPADFAGCGRRRPPSLQPLPILFFFLVFFFETNVFFFGVPPRPAPEHTHLALETGIMPGPLSTLHKTAFLRFSFPTISPTSASASCLSQQKKLVVLFPVFFFFFNLEMF